MIKINIVLFLLLAVLITIAAVTQPGKPPVSVLISSPTPSATPAVLGKTTKTSDCVSVNGMPDTACTPGGTDPAVTQENIQTTICVNGYSSRVRPPQSVTDTIKKERMTAYGYTGSKADYELDHLVSLGLGGCGACIANLWPEPYNGTTGARLKDTVESYLHRRVCNGNMTLREAQEKIATDWVSVYNSLPDK